MIVARTFFTEVVCKLLAVLIASGQIAKRDAVLHIEGRTFALPVITEWLGSSMMLPAMACSRSIHR